MMCRLSLPENEVRQTKQHFKRWVDTYMKAHPDQPYQYNSDELYAARCAVLHNYGSQANLHEKNEALKLIGYHDGGMHFVNENIDDRLVIIGTKSFINDFVLAVDRFLTDFGKDPQLKALVEKRLKDVFSIYPIS